MSKILITGATGFLGSYVAPRLVADGHEVRCLVRQGSDASRLPLGRVETVTGDLADRASLERALADMDILVNVASLGFGHAPNVVAAAVGASLKRAIFFSTTAVFTTLNAGSKSIRLGAEELVKTSGLTWSILRPTMIYGSSRDRNMCRLVRFLSRWPVFPVIGTGEHLQQPVYAADLAEAVAGCLKVEDTIGRAYNLSGGAPITYNEVIRTTARLLGRRVRILRLPAGPIIGLWKMLEKLPVRLPLKSEQIMRLNENKAFDYSEASRDFGYRPRDFEAGMRLEIEEMGLTPGR